MPHQTGKGHPYIRILSPAVCEALRAVVDYYPNLNLSTRTVDIPEPYAVFVFFEEELNEYCRRLELPTEYQQSPSCPNRFAVNHIRIVQDFVRQHVQADVQAERERHSRGFATFQMLWLLYKPGTDVYHDAWLTGEYDPHVISKVYFHLIDGATPYYSIDCWCMDATSKEVGPAMFNRFMHPFSGEKQISTLHVYPCDYLRFENGMTDDDLSQIHNHFVNRGKQWYSMRRQVKCYLFDGITLRNPRQRVSLIYVMRLCSLVL